MKKAQDGLSMAFSSTVVFVNSLVVSSLLCFGSFLIFFTASLL